MYRHWYRVIAHEYLRFIEGYDDTGMFECQARPFRRVNPLMVANSTDVLNR